MTGEIIPVPLRFGEPEGNAPHPLRYPILDDKDQEVGVVFSLDSGTYEASLFGHEPRFRAFKINQLLVLCGVWLAYLNSVGRGREGVS